ncbi:uncharacterized protein LY79DRAFT_357638 [Colletotrichum navitas]|uniref:Secreted protein n=1 Tax=Colletotrichum navitas TaxID=681940 RepID=A0AAD8PR80_9PEZI|nr:uncharacterized protein LY79DRAFT_357638 [Colletotrichum navitas]KAK1579146.1 hypothetical protein LY79DRAFT_357638 [Colletotrichum navitas]
MAGARVGGLRVVTAMTVMMMLSLAFHMSFGQSFQASPFSFICMSSRPTRSRVFFSRLLMAQAAKLGGTHDKALESVPLGRTSVAGGDAGCRCRGRRAASKVHVSFFGGARVRLRVCEYIVAGRRV